MWYQTWYLTEYMPEQRVRLAATVMVVIAYIVIAISIWKGGHKEDYPELDVCITRYENTEVRMPWPSH